MDFREPSAVVPAPWKAVQLKAEIAATRYTVEAWGGEQAIRAEAKSSMTLMVRPVSVDLKETPIMCWRWRVEQKLAKADVRQKASDDIAARVYVSMDLPASSMGVGARLALGVARNLFGQDVPDAALSYIWDNRLPLMTRLPNAYTDRAQMLVLRNHDSALRTWLEERRDLLADIQAAFGTAAAKVTAIAVASDTDNTGESTQAGFARLHFVGREQPCQF